MRIKKILQKKSLPTFPLPPGAIIKWINWKNVLCLSSHSISSFSSEIERCDTHSALKARRPSLIWTITQSYRVSWPIYSTGIFSFSLFLPVCTQGETWCIVRPDDLMFESKNFLSRIKLPYKMICSLTTVQKKGNKMGHFSHRKFARRLQRIYSVSDSNLSFEP